MSLGALVAPVRAQMDEALVRVGGVPVRSQYLLDPQLRYFNHASIGTVPRPVHDAHVAYLRLCESNPWLYVWGEPWELARAEVRRSLADYVGADAAELVLTHNTTEGFNLLANGLDLQPGDEVLFSSLNHSGASQCWHNQAHRGIAVRRFEFPVDDVVSLSAADIVAIYQQQITPRTRVLVFPHIDNLVGIRYPVVQLAQMARAAGVEFIAVDGAQSIGMVDVDIATLGVDFYAASPHKWLQAPKGTGFLYVRSALLEQIRPMWVTWGQNSWRGTQRVLEDYGTVDFPGILSVGDAIRFQQALGLDATMQRRESLRLALLEMVDDASALSWLSPRDPQLATSIYSIAVAGEDCRELAQRLYREQGMVMRAFSGDTLNALRISPNVETEIADLQRLIAEVG
jgi:isopenicillin-N epimerase